ncbi:Pathogenesis-related protein PR-1 [Capsicum annuum]|nr:Pathogenesis-related protein PR-1 [Capsicum annuum]KAF3646743.1 Pathogenesis-related protein PR-1 [Capsicum annuum]
MAYLQATSLIGKFSIFLLLCIAQTSFSSPIQTLCGRRLLTTTTPSDIVKQYLPPHNKARAKLGLPPLKWSNKLTNYASWWGHQRQVSCELVHSRSDYEENLFWGSGKDWKPCDAVMAWAKERPYYE